MPKILYVEDNFQNYRLVMRMLSLDSEDNEVIQAEDGQTALKMVPEMRPDLILMDINLPDIDGVEVTRRLRQDETLKDIPIVALTANAMVGDQERYLEAGCDDYVRKPINREDLRRVIERYCQNGAHGANGSSGNGAHPGTPASQHV